MFLGLNKMHNDIRSLYTSGWLQAAPIKHSTFPKAHLEIYTQAVSLSAALHSSLLNILLH